MVRGRVKGGAGAPRVAAHGAARPRPDRHAASTTRQLALVVPGCSGRVAHTTDTPGSAGHRHPVRRLVSRERREAATASIRAVLAARDVEVERLSSVLDFGCGCGRVLRHWRGLPRRISGTDYNPALVGWCARHLAFAEFQLNGLAPPLDYPDEAFELVYALSRVHPHAGGTPKALDG